MTPPKLILNGKAASREESFHFVESLSRSDRLIASGGYLFKSRFDGESLHIGYAAALSEGQRLHHYDIRVPDGPHLLGSISAVGEFTLLFKTAQSSGPGHPVLDEESRRIWRIQYRTFAAVLIRWGYRGEGTLDWISRKILEESAIFSPVPGTLGEIESFAE